MAAALAKPPAPAGAQRSKMIDGVFLDFVGGAVAVVAAALCARRAELAPHTQTRSKEPSGLTTFEWVRGRRCLRARAAATDHTRRPCSQVVVNERFNNLNIKMDFSGTKNFDLGGPAVQTTTLQAYETRRVAFIRQANPKAAFTLSYSWNIGTLPPDDKVLGGASRRPPVTRPLVSVSPRQRVLTAPTGVGCRCRPRCGRRGQGARGMQSHAADKGCVHGGFCRGGARGARNAGQHRAVRAAVSARVATLAAPQVPFVDPDFPPQPSSLGTLPQDGSFGKVRRSRRGVGMGGAVQRS
jgi:hypothetical protein